MEVEKLLLTPEDVALRLSLGRTNIFALMSAGRLENFKVGRRRMIPAQAVEDFVERLREENAPAILEVEA